MDPLHNALPDLLYQHIAGRLLGKVVIAAPHAAGVVRGKAHKPQIPPVRRRAALARQSLSRKRGDGAGSVGNHVLHGGRQQRGGAGLDGLPLKGRFLQQNLSLPVQHAGIVIGLPVKPAVRDTGVSCRQL